MPLSRLPLLSFVLLAAAAAPLRAQQQAPASPPARFDQLAGMQAAENSKPGARHAPARDLPVPTQEVSPEVQALIAGPYPPHMNADPKDAAAWKELINRRAVPIAAALPGLEKLGVSVQPAVIGGVLEGGGRHG